jgi:DNA-binding SARP family transcriptional activator
MEFRVLGPLEVRTERGAVGLGGRKPRAVLAMLLLHRNEPVSAERLAVALWGEDAVRGAVKTVQVHVSRLRKALGDPDRVVTTPVGYRLLVRPGELDAERFEVLVKDGTRALAEGQADRAAVLLREALSLWRGPALADVAYEPFAQTEIMQLEEQRITALEARVEADLANAQHVVLVEEIQRLVADNPSRERLTQQLMLALYRCGRQAEALDVYQRARARLASELGLEPGPGLKALQAQILEQAPSLELDLPPVESAVESSAEAEALCQAVRASRAIPRPLQFAGTAPFVGREDELDWLREQWTRIGDGARPTVVIGGEAGIGKTRLASELARAVHEQGALVLYGRCDDGLAVPYQPFVEAFRPYARAVRLDRLRAELGYLAPELGRLWPELAALGEPIRADPESERFALFEAVTALFEMVTREQRVLFVLDDLHWAANPTLLLLRHLIRSERPIGALLLGTYRETEPDVGHQLGQLLADLHRDASVQRLSIGGLDESAMAALLDVAIGPTLHERAELVRLLRFQTAGNPFFIRELLANLHESNVVPREGRHPSPGAIAAQLKASDGLRQVIDQRVARLSAPAGRALRVAAVSGARFSFAPLERVLGERSGVLDALDEAVAAGLVTEAGHNDYGFAHALVRETIYGGLGSARRVRLHRQFGEALEAVGDAEADVEALAHHFAEAAADGQGVKASGYALAAGRSATARLGYEDAAAHYERGLEALALTDQPQEQRRCELLLALGQACWGAGQLDEARQACRQAAELAEQLGDATALAQAALGSCGPHRFATAGTTAVADLLERALAALADGDSPLRAQLVGRLAAYTDCTRRKPVLARQALEMARRAGETATLADVLASIQWAIRGPDTLHESLAMAEELGCCADEVGDRQLRAQAHGWLLDHLLELGDIEAVQRELKALERLAHTRRERYFKWVLTTRHANYAHLAGDIENCEVLAHEALSHRFEGHDAIAAYTFGLQMFFLRREQGRLEELVPAVQSFSEQDPERSGWRSALAYIYVQLKRPDQARQELDWLARADFCDLPRDAFWFSNVSALCEVAVSLDDAPRAQLLYDLLSPYADRCAVAFALLCDGSVSRPLGLLATTLSRFDDAARHFEHALEMNAQIRSPLWVAHTQHDYARMLLIRGQPDDKGKALQLLDQALHTAEALGLKALADTTRPLKLTAQAVGLS